MLSDTRRTVLAFHKVMPRFSYGVTNYNPRRLEKLLTTLLDQGFSLFGSPNESHPAVLLTFDDAYAHLAETLPPLMTRFQFRPLVFVPTAWIGQPNRWDYSHVLQSTPHLSRKQITQLAASGARFGTHGHTHRDLITLSVDDLAHELTISRSILEETTGERVTAISYPFGRCNSRVESAAALAGYVGGYTMRLPRDSDSPLRLGRIPVYAFDTPGCVIRRIRGDRLEVVKAALTHACSYGTILLNRVRRM